MRNAEGYLTLKVCAKTTPARWSADRQNDPTKRLRSADDRAVERISPQNGRPFVVKFMVATSVSQSVGRSVGRSLGRLSRYKTVSQAAAKPESVHPSVRRSRDGRLRSGASTMLLTRQRRDRRQKKGSARRTTCELRISFGISQLFRKSVLQDEVVRSPSLGFSVLSLLLQLSE